MLDKLSSLTKEDFTPGQVRNIMKPIHDSNAYTNEHLLLMERAAVKIGKYVYCVADASLTLSTVQYVLEILEEEDLSDFDTWKEAQSNIATDLVNKKKLPKSRSELLYKITQKELSEQLIDEAVMCGLTYPIMHLFQNHMMGNCFIPYLMTLKDTNALSQGVILKAKNQLIMKELFKLHLKGFNNDQLEHLSTGLENGFDISYADTSLNCNQIFEINEAMKHGIDITGYKDFSSACLREIWTGIEAGLDVSIYAHKAYSCFIMNEMKIGLMQGIDLTPYVHAGFQQDQLMQIREGLIDGVDVSQYLDTRLTRKEMKDIRESLKE